MAPYKKIIVACVIFSISIISYAYQPHYKPIQHFINHIWLTNPVIQSAKSKVLQSAAIYSQNRRPIYNPSIGFEAEQVRNDTQDDRYAVGINQTIDLYNKQGARAQVSQHAYVKAKANLAFLKLNLATKTLTALAQYNIAKEVVTLAKRRTELLQRFKQQNERKFKSGDIAQDAVDQASLAYSEAISQQADEEILLTRAKQELIAISQIAKHAWPNLPNYLPNPIHPSKSLQQHWLQILPIMQRANADVAITQAAIRVAKTETKADPTLSILGGDEDNRPLIGAGISIPLFIRNNYRDLVHAASHQAIATEQSRLNLYRHAKANLSGDLTRYQILYAATLKWQHASKNSLTGGIQLLNRLWTAGEMSTTVYLVQLKQRIDSQIAGVKLRGEAWQAWFALMESSGQLNKWLNSRK